MKRYREWATATLVVTLIVGTPLAAFALWFLDVDVNSDAGVWILLGSYVVVAVPVQIYLYHRMDWD